MSRRGLPSIEIFSLLLSLGICSAQSDVAPLLSSRDLVADAAILRRAYEQLHPGLYRYSSQAEMDAAFTALYESLGRDQTLADAFVHFSEFAAKVRCGHTQANPFNQSKSLMQALFNTRTRLPFYFVWLNGAMIVTRDFTPNRQLPAGTEVAAIDGVPAGAILKRLLSIARADGSNDAKRIAQLGVNGDSEFETFDLYYPLMFPPRNARYEIEVRTHSKQSAKLTVEPLTPEERVAPIRDREQQRRGGNEPLFEWKDLPERIAYLRMPTWALYNSKWDWKKWLNAHLDDAADRRALVIDLRGNEGGNDAGNEVIAHLIQKPLQVSSMRRLVRYRKVPEDIAKYLDTWDKSFFDWGSAAVDLKAPWPTAPADIPYLRLTRFDDDAGAGVIQPAERRLHGKVIVLIDATNSSATFQFAQALQQNRLATLVGQPTGGSRRGINGGAFFFLHLPHSGIEMDVPLIGTFPDSPMPDSGVKPDVTVRPTASDIASGKDVVLERALRMAR